MGNQVEFIAGPNGKISPSGIKNIETSPVYVTFTANEGYRIDKVYFNGALSFSGEQIKNGVIWHYESTKAAYWIRKPSVIKVTFIEHSN